MSYTEEALSLWTNWKPLSLAAVLCPRPWRQRIWFSLVGPCRVLALPHEQREEDECAGVVSANIRSLICSVGLNRW